MRRLRGKRECDGCSRRQGRTSLKGAGGGCSFPQAFQTTRKLLFVDQEGAPYLTVFWLNRDDLLLQRLYVLPIMNPECFFGPFRTNARYSAPCEDGSINIECANNRER